jgi:uncharacterized protein
MIRRLSALLLFAALAFSQAVDPSATGRKALDLLLAQKYPDLRAMFNAEMDEKLPEAALRAIGGQIAPLGAVENIGQAQIQDAPNGLHLVAIPVKFAQASLIFQVTLAQDGKIAGMFLRPASPPPGQ